MKKFHALILEAKYDKLMTAFDFSASVLLIYNKPI